MQSLSCSLEGFDRTSKPDIASQYRLYLAALFTGKDYRAEVFSSNLHPNFAPEPANEKTRPVGRVLMWCFFELVNHSTANSELGLHTPILLKLSSCNLL